MNPDQAIAKTIATFAAMGYPHAISDYWTWDRVVDDLALELWITEQFGTHAFLRDVFVIAFRDPNHAFLFRLHWQ